MGNTLPGRVADLESDRYRPLLVRTGALCQCRFVDDEYIEKTDRQLAARCAAIASVGAGVIHLAVTPMHWRDWLPSGLFLAALACFQVLWAFIVWSRPYAPVLAAGIAVNVGAAWLWITSCVAGPPVGPAAGQPEAVGAAGIAVLLLQCYVVMGSAWSWSRKYQAHEVQAFKRAAVLIAANTVMAGAVAVGLVASLQGHHHHHHGPALEAESGHHAGVGGHHPSAPQSPTEATGSVHPPDPGEAGLPITDMALNTDGDHHPEAAVPSAPSVMAPAPAESASDGHSHDHDD